MKKIISVLVLSLALVACGNTKAQNDVVTVGVVGSDSKEWRHVKEEAAKEGIELEIKYFDDYSIPNRVLNEGEIDLNSFQHIAYLDKEIEQLGYELTPIGNTSFAPLGIYSEKIKDISEIKDGGKVSIPDDVTNGGRALLLLQQAGLIKVDPAAGYIPRVKDITDNPKNLEIVELAATTLAPTMSEVEVAVINSGVAVTAGLIPSQDAIVLEKVESADNPYVNVIVAQTSRKDEEKLKKIVELYQSDEVKKIIEEENKGSVFPQW